MISVYNFAAFGSWAPHPSQFQYILNPFSALWYLEREYDLYDGSYNLQGYYFNERDFIPKRRHGGYQGSRHSHPNRIWTLVETMLKQGDMVVCDDTHGWSSQNPFYIDDNGDLVQTQSGFHQDPYFFSNIKSRYQEALNRELSLGRSKPSATNKHVIHYTGASTPDQHAQSAKAGKTLNSKSVGRLLAAGGVYNGNVEGFRETAEKLGGEAPEGFTEVYNQQSAGMLMAGMSLFGLKKVMSMSEMAELKDFLGKYKQEPVLLRDMEVKRIDYLRRDRAELTALRRKFDNGIRSSFMKDIAGHPDVKATFDQPDLDLISRGGVPKGWNVHHKIPLDDGGTNDFDNLILIKNSPYHSALTKAQKTVTSDLLYGQSKTTLWPMPTGVIYPKP